MIKKGSIVKIKKSRNHNDGYPNSNHNFAVNTTVEIIDIYPNNIVMNEFLIKVRKIDGNNQFANVYENEIDFGPLTKESINSYKILLKEEINSLNKKIEEFDNLEKKLEQLKLKEIDLEILKIYDIIDNDKTSDSYKLAKKIQSFLIKGNLPKKGKKQTQEEEIFTEQEPF